MIKTEKTLRLRSHRGHKVRVVREHYLRERVPCYSSLCRDHACANEGKLLPDDLTHYVVPDAGVVLDFLGVLELAELRGIVFTRTACQALQGKGRGYYNRLRSLLRDPGRDCILFANDFQKYSYCPREKGETQDRWQTRCAYSAAAWYRNHLAGSIEVVMITEDLDAASRYGDLTSGVFVVTVQDYLQDFWPEVRAAHELFAAIRQGKEDGGKKEYTEHLPAVVLEAGVKSGRYVQGVLKVNKYRPQDEAFVVTDGLSNMLVRGSEHRNRAVHGDTVAVELLPRGEWKAEAAALAEGRGNDRAEDRQQKPVATGRVVGILQRNWRDYVVTFPAREGTPPQSRNSQRVLVVPWDRRVPKIRVGTQRADALQDHRVVVRIDSWDSASPYPSGHTVGVLGRAGELETEIQTILVENRIRVPPFSDAQLREMPANSPAEPWHVDPAEAARRRDLRQSHLVFSIDPQGCEDVDDALSVRPLPGGRLLELGVHIADVTHFVAQGSLTDLEARSRATTCYLADRRYDMLPAVLSSDLCSLLGGVDRYAVSVLWELDAETLAVSGVWYGRTLLRSSYQLDYERAQALLDGEPADVPELAALTGGEKGTRLAELTGALEALTHVARRLRARRDRGGALELEGVEVRAQLDQDRNVAALVPRQPLEVHETVAECMIYANHWVARKIQETFATRALLRRHPPPRQELLRRVAETAAARGLDMETGTNKALADSLDRALDPEDPLVNRLLRMMATQAMSQALYFSTGDQTPDQFYHYGLALDRYTHFTSPIRRYADMVVHRLLTAALQTDGGAQSPPGHKELAEMARHINAKSKAAQRAQNLSTRLFQCLYFKDKDPPCVADAIIYAIRDNSVLAFVPEFGLKGAVYLKNGDGQAVSTEAGPRGGSATFGLFDHITVCISVQSTPCHADTLKLELVQSELHRSMAARPRDRNQLVQEVARQAEEAAAAQVQRRPRLTEDEREYRQSETPNLYSLLEEVRELALRELALRELAATA